MLVKENIGTGDGSRRQQHRMDTLNLQLRMEQFPLKKTRKLSEQLLCNRQMRKMPHQSGPLQNEEWRCGDLMDGVRRPHGAKREQVIGCFVGKAEAREPRS